MFEFRKHHPQFRRSRGRIPKRWSAHKIGRFLKPSDSLYRGHQPCWVQIWPISLALQLLGHVCQLLENIPKTGLPNMPWAVRPDGANIQQSVTLKIWDIRYINERYIKKFLTLTLTFPIITESNYSSACSVVQLSFCWKQSPVILLPICCEQPVPQVSIQFCFFIHILRVGMVQVTETHANHYCPSAKTIFMEWNLIW